MLCVSFRGGLQIENLRIFGSSLFQGPGHNIHGDLEFIGVKVPQITSRGMLFWSITLDIQSYLLRRCFGYTLEVQTPSQQVFGCLG